MARECATPVVTTDVSLEGAGIISWQEIPVRHLILQLPELCFACDVRWSRQIGPQVYRYGLRFLRLVDSPGGDSQSDLPAAPR